MANFDSSKTGGQSKNFNDLAEEFIPFWTNLFESLKLPSIEFKTKLCYGSKEFKLDEDGDKPLAIRFFKSELSSNKDIYIELCNWDHNFFDPMNRSLYKLTNNPEWEMDPEKYVKSKNTSHPSYAVKITDLELVNTTSITKAKAEIIKTPTKPSEKETPEIEEEYSDLFEDQEDDHFSKMTMRDLYCMLQNKPYSNKKWLNKLINKK